MTLAEFKTLANLDKLDFIKSTKSERYVCINRVVIDGVATPVVTKADFDPKLPVFVYECELTNKDDSTVVKGFTVSNKVAEIAFSL
jgi:hypothetical protein